MEWVAGLVIAGLLVGRWWIVAAAPVALVAGFTIAAVADNFWEACDRPDGCGTGPVLGTVLLSTVYAAAGAAVLAAGVAARRELGRHRQRRN